MATSYQKSLARRKLKVERLRLQGVPLVEISRRLKISYATVRRYASDLDLEAGTEPAYTQDRLKLREEFSERYYEELLEIKKDLEAARRGSQTSEETERPFKAGEVKPIKDPQKLLDVGMGAKQVEITRKVFGPDWKAVAHLHRVLLDCIVNWAKLFGLQIEKETRVTATEEKVVTGRVVLPEKAKSSEEWQTLADLYKAGQSIGVLDDESIEERRARGEKLEVWDPEKKAFLAVSGGKDKKAGK